jgi:hypothetical protein
MDWDLVIKRKSEALNAIVAGLFAMLELSGEATVSRLPRAVYFAVLRMLRPAESAVRRLIVIAARGLVVKLAPSRPMPKGHTITKGGRNRPPAFRLCDTRKDFPELREPRVKCAKHPPRILFFGPDSRIDDRGPGPWPFRRRPPMARSARRASTAGSRPSRQPSMICPARPNASPAGGKGGKPCRARCSSRRSARARRPAAASATFTRSMTSSPIATGSPGMRCEPTRAEAEIVSIRNNLTAPLPRLRRTLSHGGEREPSFLALAPCGREPAPDPIRG